MSRRTTGERFGEERVHYERQLDRPRPDAPIVTKRDHDRATKENWGYRGAMASDERAHYRSRRLLPDRHWQGDRIMTRGAEMTARNAHERRPGHPVRYFDRDGFLPTLGVASRFRAPARWRAQNGKPLLDL